MKRIRNVLTDKKLWILLSLACAIRLYIWYVTPVFAKDGISFINIATRFTEGNFYEGLKHPYHPLYSLLISLGAIAGLGFEISGRLVSLFFGTLSVAILYVFGKKMFDPKIAFVSATLLTFHPYAARLSADVRCDSTYFFFYLVGFGLGYIAIISKKSYLFFLTGMASAFAYLTRPEGLSIVIIVSIWTIIQLIGFGKPYWKNNVRMLCLLLIGFLIFSSPYILYLKHYTNFWVLTQKKQISKISGIATIKEVLYGSQKSETSGTQNTKIDKSSQIKTVYKDKGNGQWHKSRTDSIHRYSSRMKYLKSFVKTLNTFVVTLHYPLLIFLIIGIKCSINDSKNKTVNFYIVSYIALFWCVLYFLKISSGYVSYRHLMSLVLVMLFWTGMGVNNTYNWLIRKIPKWQQLQSDGIFSKTGIIFLCLIIALFLPKTLKSFMADTIYKDAGMWIKAFYPEVPTILTDEPSIAFYATTQRLKIPKKSSYDEIIQYARRKKTNLIVVTQNITNYDRDFFSKINHNEVKELLELVAKKRKVVIYKVLN